MLNIKNMGPVAFRDYLIGKDIYIFGAGRSLESCLDLYFDGVKINKIIDNNPDLWGSFVVHGQEKIEIINIKQLISEINKKGIKQSLLMITSTFYATEIVEELDRIRELDGMECFLQVLIRNTKEEIKPFEFTTGKKCIPKRIHYIWIGGKELPDKYKRNIESWRKYNPDYEIIQWDESSYDFGKIPYMKEAYTCHAWGFVSNYARLDIVYQQGGIYLDTDVDVIKSLDPLLNDQAFFCMGCADRINMGCGFGAVEKHTILLDMMNTLNNEHFLLENGGQRRRAYHLYIHPIIKKYGFDICNQYQKRSGVVLYPTEVMSPLTIEGMQDFRAEKTLSFHQESGTWRDEKEKKGYEEVKRIIQTRLYGHTMKKDIYEKAAKSRI